MQNYSIELAANKLNQNSLTNIPKLSFSKLMLTTALVSVISVGITSAIAAEPISIESETSVNQSNTAPINATGNEESAIEIVSLEDVVFTNSGALSSSGDMGIFLGAAGDTDLSNNADVSSFEESLNIFGYKSANADNTGSLTADHLAGISAGSFGDVAVKNTGEVEAAQGVYAFSTAGTPEIDELGLSSAPATNGGTVTIDNEGDISLTVEFDKQQIESQGIEIEYNEIGILGLATNGLTISSEYYADGVLTENTDEISTALSTNPDGLDVKITNKGDIADDNKTDSPTSIGIGAGALGDVTIKNEGDIDVSLIAIYTLAGGDIDVVNDGALEVSGSDAVGIELEHLEDAEADITLTNNGDITATNADEAIDIDSGGTATVKNTGDIDGGTYVGIEVEAAGAVNVTNSGKIETTGYNSDGIAVSSETSDTTVNSGEIIASDAGIRAGGFGPTKVTNQKDGNIHGGNIGIDSGGGGASTIVNAGKLESDEIGISGVVFGGTAEFIEKDEDGTKTKKKFTVTGGELDITNSGTITMVSPNSRDETTYEFDGHTLKVPENVAIFAASLNGGTEINKQYDEFGQPYDDRDEFTALADDAANNAVTIANSGTIDGSSSDSSHGIYAMASDGVDIDNSGDITVANEAIFVTGISPVSIVNSGNIKVSNSGKVAISASSHQESGGPSGKSVSVKNSGKIVASGFDTYGIEINHEALGTVENSGEISALNNGINAGGYGNLVVTNQKTGNIHGVSIGISGANGGGSKITNAGKIEANKAGIDAVTFGGKGTIADGDGSSFDVSVPGGKIDIINSGTITMITPTFETNDVFELDGHSLSVPANTGIFAVSMNGGSHTSRYTDDSGQQQEESSKFTPIAADAADNSVSVTNSGTIDGTATNWSHGIYAMASDGVDVDNSGDIKVGASAIYAISNSPITIKNSGTIKVDGEFGAHAVQALSGDGENYADGEAISIENSGTIDLTGAGKNRRAVQAWSNGGAVTISNSGMVTTTANGSRGLQAASGTVSRCNFDENDVCSKTTAVDGGVVTINSSKSVTTAGEYSDAIYTWSSNGVINIDTSGTLTTKGKNSNAIQASSGEIGGGTRKNVAKTGGAITINNSAVIGTNGEEAQAINAFSNGGTVDATNEGKITTAGKSARGINLRSGNSSIKDGGKASDGGTITLTNKVGGDISTTGQDASALQAGSSNGNVFVINNAKLSTEGKDAVGIVSNSGNNSKSDDEANFKGGNLSIINSAAISTKGIGANGIGAWTNGGLITVDNSGAISTSGEESHGLGADTGTNSTDDNQVIQAGSDITVLNSGTITTDKKSSNGINTFSNGGAVQITLKDSSAITTKGDAALGLSAYTGTSSTADKQVIKDGGNVVADLDGTISTSGAGADGVRLGSYGGAVTLTNNAKVSTSGSGSNGVIIGSGSTGTNGSVARDGGKVTITNAADVVVTGADSNGFVAYAPNNIVMFNNSAVISASGGKAIVVDNATADITNSGSLIGGASFSANADTLTNTGTLENKFYFGAGDDVLNLNAGSVYKDAIFDGEDGTDNANFSGGGALAGAEFKNFETATLADGSWTLSDTLNSFNTFNVANKSTLVLNKGVLGAAQTNILAESTLKGSGTISGGLTNNGSILLTSTDTLKINGDFHNSENSKIQFALGGDEGGQHSKIEVTGGKFTFDAIDDFSLAVEAGTKLKGNTRYKIVTADGGVKDSSPENDLDPVEISTNFEDANQNSAAFDFETTIEDNSLWVSVRAIISETVKKLAPNLAEEAGAVEEFVVDNPSGGALAEQLNGLNETQLVAAVAELTAPNEAAGHQSLNSTVSTANNIVDNRIAGRISGSSQRNFYTGDQAAQNSYRADAGQTEASKVVMAYGGEGIVGSQWLDDGGYTQAWVQTFWGNSTIENSDSNQYGTSVGVDFRPDQNTLIGGSFSYSRTDADATNSSLEADTYGGMLYGAKGFDSGLAFSGVIGYFHTQNESKRQALGSIYSGDFDSNTFTLSGNVSQEIDLQQDWLFTPNAGIRYSHATFDDYTETGGTAPLTISRSDVNSVELSAEASFIRNFNVTETTKGLFEFHFGGLYEAGDNDSTVAYRFSPTGAMLYSNTDVARLKFNVGTLVEIPFSDQISSEFGYEGTFANDYADHLLRAKFKVKF